MLLSDIFITTKDRPELLKKSLDSFTECTDRNKCRITIIRDGDYDCNKKIIEQFGADFVLTNVKNRGLGPSINMALSHIDALKRWDVNPPILTTYVQDDVQYSKGWLETLSQNFMQLEASLKLGFASGVECLEHLTRKDLGNGLVLKDSIRGTNMMAKHDYWMSMWPISRIDPDTGRERGRPHDGLGSGVDWWFIRSHQNSVCRTGKTCLVMPGLLKHLGYRNSTWYAKALPESQDDKKEIEVILRRKNIEDLRS